MKKNIWHDDYVLADLLMDTNKSMYEIAEILEISQTELQNRIKIAELDWIRRTDRKISRGQSALTDILKKLLPREKIVNEYHLGDRLRLDIYCPNYKLGIEYHGRQHFMHIGMFHPTYDDFIRAQQRDTAKAQKCKELDITLVVFRYDDDLSEEAVYNRVLEAIRQHSDNEHPAPKVKKKWSMKDHPFYDEIREKRRVQERMIRRRIRQEQKAKEKQRLTKKLHDEEE